MSTLSGTRLRLIGADLAEQRANMDTKKANDAASAAQRRADGDNPDKKRARLAAGNAKRSATQKGHEQFNAVEGALLGLLVAHFKKYLPREEFEKLRFLYLFDCNKADFAIGRVGEDKYTAVQIKTATIEFGKATNYHLKPGDYVPHMYCICIGGRECVMNALPTDANDTSTSGAYIFETIDVGATENIKTSLSPTPGVPYSGIDPSWRLYPTFESFEANRAFYVNMVNSIYACPVKFTEAQLNVGTNGINEGMAKNHKVEKFGFDVLGKALAPFGYTFEPVKRQNEAVDGMIVGESFKCAVSMKTGKENHKNKFSRRFDLGKAPNKQNVDVVIALYGGEFNRAAVMHRETVYVDGMKSFCWNEKDFKPGVAIFDLNEKLQVEALIAHLKKLKECPELQTETFDIPSWS